LGHKRPKQHWLPGAKSTTEQRVKFAPQKDIPDPRLLPADLPLDHRARQTEAASLSLPCTVVVSCSGATARGRQVATITKWLASLGLAEYAQRFAENGIDVSVLRYLTDQDLEKIGVLLGHRRKMLAAIAELSGAAPVMPQPANPPEAKRRHDAERRQLTVMFTDLVGSTALSTRIDPEDLREVIGAYHRCVAETIVRFDGFVAKYMGDGVLIYFGYPEAHEDDAERAVRAGLALVEAVRSLTAPEPLQVRIGIGTGLVVVGDLVGSGEAQERGVVGETPNLAARLQAIAAPGAIVIGQRTRRLLAGLFEYRDLGCVEVKGFARPVQAYEVLRPRTVESRFEALHATGLTALVGREEESELLFRRWSRAKTGEGQVVLITGEAGIGKSRLTAELLERLAAELHTRLRYFCSPQHTDSAFYPIVGQLERSAGLAHDDAPQAKLDKLDAVLAQTSTSIEDAALFAEMLSLANDGRYPVRELTPQQRRQETLQAFVSQLEALTRRSPVLMIFEDAHWTDPTSLELLGRAVDRIQTLPVLLIVTLRPGSDPPWIGQPHVTALTINRLTQREVDVMIDRVLGPNRLSAGTRQDIIERTDGIPLFVEEMTKAVLEAESEGEARRTAAAVPSPARPVPASLHASLMARLDRLGPAKEVAQIGAAIGREFSHALLASVLRKPEVELRSALERISHAGLLFRQDVPPHATYVFKHALVQDAAYGTLLREPRRALHARVVEALEGQFADIVENQPELLAHHCTEAGLIEKAASLWGKAGQRSLERSALVEATAQLSRGLAQIASLPATPGLRREQIKLQVALVNTLMHTKGHAAPETKASLNQARLYVERADALGEPSEDPLLLFSVLYGFCLASYVAFNGDVMRERADQFLTLAEKQRATIPVMIGHRLMGTSFLFTGDIAEARAHFNQVIALYHPAQHRLLAKHFVGVDTGVAALSYRSLAHWVLGYPDSALADRENALKLAREIRQAATLMFALAITLLTLIHCGKYAAVNAQADEIIALADQKGSPLWKTSGLLIQGCVLALAGNSLDAVHMLTAGIAAWRSTGATLWIPFYLPYMAKAGAELRHYDDARRCIDEAMTATQTSKETWCEADIHRTAGEITLMSHDPNTAKAEACFERALVIARKQQAKSFELRAAMSMARLWRDQGRRQHANDLLAPVYGWFTEGFDTLDLKNAKDLLGELTQ
jgi:class 3 adenylate cyclase/predicted ATPase